ncbi:MAG TPA: DNA-3-methyladenine glycosylase I [Acidimicrobiia bacterium]|nr:DNA-3-methyladenine glycosylase I [Acidimicrobiia bacterium]
MQEVVVGQDGLARCWWGSGPEYVDYHDQEWGRPATDDSRLFEKLCLEGFQSGLSWLTILRKRPAFRSAFAEFDPVLVAGFDEADVTRLLADRGIVRHQGKIRSTINNANRALKVIEENGSLTAFFWSYADPSDQPQIEIPPTTKTSTRLAKDLKKRGFTFVGPTTVYAFMQAMGLVNDHLADCHARQACAEERSKTLASR